MAVSAYLRFVLGAAVNPLDARNNLQPEVDPVTVYNTGVFDGITRQDWTGSYTFSSPNQVYENYNFYGYVKPRAPGIIFRNCWNYGPSTLPTSQQALFDCASSLAPNTKFYDCTAWPQVTNRFVNGWQGGNFSAYRCRAKDVVDYFSCYAGNGTTDPLNITIQQCLGDGMHGESPDSSHTDNLTHNDGIQIQGGSGPFLAWGNDLYAGYYKGGSWTQGSGGLAPLDRGTGDETNGRYQSNLGFCVIQFTNIGSWFPHHTESAPIEILGNIIRGGNRGINAGSANNTNIGRWWRNWFDNDQGIRSSNNLALGGGHCANTDATTTMDAGEGTSNANLYLPELTGGQRIEIPVRRNQ